MVRGPSNQVVTDKAAPKPNEKASICGFAAPTTLGRLLRRNLRGSTSHGWGTSEGGRNTDGEEDGTVREGERNLPFCECG